MVESALTNVNMRGLEPEAECSPFHPPERRGDRISTKAGALQVATDTVVWGEGREPSKNLS